MCRQLPEHDVIGDARLLEATNLGGDPAQRSYACRNTPARSAADLSEIAAIYAPTRLTYQCTTVETTRIDLHANECQALEAALRVARRSSVLMGSDVTKIHRNFKWLPLYPGDVSMTSLPADVLTGPMSGCVLKRFMHNGG